MKTTIINSGILLSAAFCALAAQANYPEKQKPEVELTHWWNYPGELAALDEIKKAVTAKGSKFTDTKLPSWDKLRSSLINRITLGYPPAITQWLGDKDMFELNKINAVYAAPTQWRGESLEDKLLEEVTDSLTANGELISLPLGIHIQNSAIFNAEIYRELGLELPKSWQEFIEQAPQIQKAGFVPLAFSKEPWQLQMVFNTILLEQAGHEDYQALYDKKKSIKQWRKPLEKAFDIFLKLARFADEGSKTRSWNEAIKMIGQKRAAMHVLGDFAKGELTAMGLTAGEDFLCSLTPGSNGTMIYVIDGFLMLNVDEGYLKKGQEILFDTVLDPKVQAAYNSKKGSIPIRKDVDLSHLDACSQQRYSDWIRADKKHATFSDIRNPVRTSFFQSTLMKGWADNSISAKEMADHMISIDDAALNNGKLVSAKN